MNATEIKKLIGQNVIITTTDGRVKETVLRKVRTHKATNTVAGVLFDSELTSTFQGVTTTRKCVARMPAARISSIKVGA